MFGAIIRRFVASKRDFRPKRPEIILFALMILLALTPLRAISFLLVLYCYSRFIHIRVGAIGKCVMAYLLFSVGLSALGAAAWAFQIPLTSGPIILLLVMSLGVLWWIVQRPSQLIPAKSELFDPRDLASLGLAIAVGFILILPLGGKLHVNTLAPVVMTGGDNSAHMEMIKTVDLNHGLSIGTSNRINMPANLFSYPQGWHLSGAFTLWLAQGLTAITSSPLKFLLFFYVFSVIWFCLLAFMLARLSFYLLDSGQKRLSPLALLTVLFVCATGIAGWLFSLFEFGFQTHIGALVLLLGEILLLLEAYRRAPAQRYRLLVLALLVAGGIGIFWLFLLPVALLIAGICLLQTVLRSRSLPPTLLLVILVAIGWFIAFQPLMQIGFAAEQSTSDTAVNLRGNVVHTSMFPLIMIFIALGIYVYYRFTSKSYRLVYLTLGLALGFSLVLMAYQLNTIEELRYYYFKSNFTFIILATVLLAALAAELVGQLARARPPRSFRYSGMHTALILGALLVLGSAGFWQFKSPAFDDFLHGRLHGVSSAQADAIASLLAKDTNLGVSILPIGSCNRGDDIRAAQLAHALLYSPRTTSPSAYSAIQLSYLDKQYLLSAASNYAKSRPLIIISNDLALSTELKGSLSPAAAKNTSFIDLDTTLETEPVSQCFDRVRTLSPEEITAGIK